MHPGRANSMAANAAGATGQNHKQTTQTTILPTIIITLSHLSA
jgi:hypothetical protein